MTQPDWLHRAALAKLLGVSIPNCSADASFIAQGKDNIWRVYRVKPSYYSALERWDYGDPESEGPFDQMFRKMEVNDVFLQKLETTLPFPLGYKQSLIDLRKIPND